MSEKTIKSSPRTPLAQSVRGSSGKSRAELGIETLWGCVRKDWGWGMKTELRGLALAAMAGLGVVGMAAVAPAADLAVKPAAPPFNWTGCYLGGTLGWGNANTWRVTDLGAAGVPYNPGGVNPWTYSLDSVAVGGGTLGCNWQPTSFPVVIGLEGEGGYLNLDGGNGNQLFGTRTVVDSSKVGTGYGMVGGRAGWVFLDRILVYGKVGVGFYDTSSTVTDFSPGGITATGKQSQSPFAFGGGIEYAMTDHWFGKAEFLYFERGTSYLACGGAFCWREDPSNVNVFKLGLSYKFW